MPAWSCSTFPPRKCSLDCRTTTLDVALTVGQERARSGLKWTQLVEVSWQLAVHRRHRLARLARISSANVAHEPLLVFCQRDYPEYWNIVTDWLREQRQRPAIAGEYDGVNSLLAAVESGLGVALVTTSTSRLIPKNVRLSTLSSPPKRLCIAAGYALRAEGELLGLLTKAERLFHGKGLQPFTIYTAVGLMVTTGMRISEVLRLRVEDVDLKNQILTVRGSKFHKLPVLPIAVLRSWTEP
jgi:integrase